MAKTTVPQGRYAEQIKGLLRSPEVAALIADLEATRWTGRPGYPIRTMVGMTLVKSLYVLPTWTRTVRLVAEHAAIRKAIGGAPRLMPATASPPSCAATRAPLTLASQPSSPPCTPSFRILGQHVAIDGSDLPAYANGQRFVSKGGRLRERFSDRVVGAPFGRLHPQGRRVLRLQGPRRRLHRYRPSGGMGDAHGPRRRGSRRTVPAGQIADYGITSAACIADKGYDAGSFYEACEARNVRPVAPLRQTRKVAAGEHLPPTCEHGTWTFAGSDAKRGAAKYRCPSGECSPASVWIKADRLHTLIPRETARWKGLYRGRAAVEREFGRLKHEWALLPLRVRRIERVRLHADLTVLSRLAVARAEARAVSLAA